MVWNWQLPEWPKFIYDPSLIAQKERQFLLNSGQTVAFFRNIGEEERNQFIVEILSLEGLESSRIEGEILERESLQSSIKKHFGLQMDRGELRGSKERGMAELLCRVYETYDDPLTHQMLWDWHAMLFREQPGLEEYGQYRTHQEPMQIVSGRLDSRKVFYEAPPSERVPLEMERFIEWYNASRAKQPALERAALAHVYFECIHPFKDGNGRIGRILSEKILSLEIGQPTLIAVSRVIEKQRKRYYAELERCNRTLAVPGWVDFFAEVIIQAQADAMQLLYFLIEKSKMLIALSGKINPRQEKALLRMFAEGIEGFSGGLSAENYIAITKTSRATATRDLSDLVEKGALIKTGELRHTRYWLHTAPRSHRAHGEGGREYT